MGLDMYLEREIYVGRYQDGTIDDTVDFAGMSGQDMKIQRSKVTKLRVEEAYWRKANAIHKWFVDNIQDGVDDCGTYEVPDEDLVKLYETCSKAYLTKDPTLIPPGEGFFFGSAEVDDYYWQQIYRTMGILNPMMEELKKGFDERTDEYRASSFYYSSSW